MSLPSIKIYRRLGTKIKSMPKQSTSLKKRNTRPTSRSKTFVWYNLTKEKGKTIENEKEDVTGCHEKTGIHHYVITFRNRCLVYVY